MKTTKEKHIKDWINKKLMKLKRKYWISQTIWVSLNVLVICLTTLLSILSVYSIAKNTSSKTIWIFVTLALIASTTAFLTNLFNMLELNDKTKMLKEEIQKLEKGKTMIEKMNFEELQSFLIELANADLFWK